MHDPLGDRIKSRFEDRNRIYLPRRTYTIIRLDGKSFHTYTRAFTRPFDKYLMDAMDHTAEVLCEHIQGAQFAYVQSDEISILLTDFAKANTDAWFDGNVQKMVSVSASVATYHFNEYIRNHFRKDMTPAYFDSRAFTIPDQIEVQNYFRWRNVDCSRNSLNSVAQYHFSQKKLQGKNLSEVHELLFSEKQVNWAKDFSEREKNGGIVLREDNKWVTEGAWKFSSDDGKLLSLIPKHGYDL